MEEKRIGELIRLKRKELGLSQFELGRMVNITKGGVSKLELTGYASNELRIKVSEILKIDFPLKPIPEYKKYVPLKKRIKQLEESLLSKDRTIQEISNTAEDWRTRCLDEMKENSRLKGLIDKAFEAGRSYQLVKSENYQRNYALKEQPDLETWKKENNL
jgi:transcriptional regulator with XRE-family HTH domain